MNPGGAGNIQSQWNMYKTFKVCSCKACWSKYMGVEGADLDYWYSRARRNVLSGASETCQGDLCREAQTRNTQIIPSRGYCGNEMVHFSRTPVWQKFMHVRKSLCVSQRSKTEPGGTWSNFFGLVQHSPSIGNIIPGQWKALISEQHQTNMCSLLAMEKWNTRPALFMTFHSRCQLDNCSGCCDS